MRGTARARWVSYAIVLAALMVGLVAAAALDGKVPSLVADDSLRALVFQAPVLVTYLLCVLPLIARRRREVVRALGDLLSAPARLDCPAPKPWLKDWRAWLATALSLVIAIGVDWDVWPRATESWLGAYTQITRPLMFWLSGQLVYRAWESIDTVVRLQRQPLRIDLFDLTFLRAVSSQALTTALAIIGGITISLLFVPLRLLLVPWNLITYGILAATLVVTFFLSLGSTHQLLVETKRRELSKLRARLTAAYALWSTAGSPANGAPAPDVVRAWLAWERRIDGTQEWPFDAEAMRGLTAAVLAPAVAVVVRVVLETPIR